MRKRMKFQCVRSLKLRQLGHRISEAEEAEEEEEEDRSRIVRPVRELVSSTSSDYSKPRE